jgi:hypothetical protein
MGRNRLTATLTTLLAALALVLEGCTATPSAISTPNPSSTESAPASVAPSATPISDSRFVTNKFSASDGTHVYYFSSDGVRRMDMDGGNDTVTGISQCYDFLSIDEDGLYYLARDDDYTPTETGQRWEGDSLMFYDGKTGNSKTLMPHVFSACALGSNIYAVDHLKPSHIVRYDTEGKSFTDVTGLPSGSVDGDVVTVFSELRTGTVYLILGNRRFIISGDSIGAPPEEEPDYGNHEDPGYLAWNTDIGVVSIKTDSGYKKLELPGGVSDLTRYLSKYYARVSGSTAGSGTTSLYEVSPDGTFRMVAAPVAVDFQALVTDEIAGGWYFSIQINAGTAYALLFKQKIG